MAGLSVFELTPPSVALYAMAVCMIKWEVRPFMQMAIAYSVDLHGFVRAHLANYHWPIVSDNGLIDDVQYQYDPTQ